MSAILLLYREVPAVDLLWLSDFRRARESQKLPVVLTEDEVRSVLVVLVYLDGIKWLMMSLWYGSGMRLMGMHPSQLRSYVGCIPCTKISIEHQRTGAMA
ncbi:MAG: hypothetical protein ACRESZ_16960 [Methylococcales bacterium]